MRIVNYNIYSPRPTEQRAKNVFDTVDARRPDVICLQEVTPYWMELIRARYGEKFGILGEAREEGRDAEYNPVLYRLDKYEAMDCNTFWLSDTPTVCSRLPESKYYRICTVSTLLEKATGKRFRAVCVHLDYVWEAAGKQAKILLDLLEENGDLPTFFCGDFNTPKESPAYETLAASEYRDASEVATIRQVLPTFQKFGQQQETIDFCFVKCLNVLEYSVEEVRVNGEYPSDHNPLYIEAQ